jgi:multimeric flavodoxin WrbA
VRIVIINGQGHKGSTRMVARELAERVGGEITEFFLPRDFDEPCVGCWTCFKTDLTHCPHYARLEPIANALDEADLIILASPVYVYHATGQMMALLDHFGTRWMVHRPDPRYFRKQGVCVSTAAGGGMRTTNRDMADSLAFWGVPRIHRLGFAIHAGSPAEISERSRAKIERKVEATARRIRSDAGRRHVGARNRYWFFLMRFLHRGIWRQEPDWSYWEERGWHAKGRPWK